MDEPDSRSPRVIVRPEAAEDQLLRQRFEDRPKRNRHIRLTDEMYIELCYIQGPSDDKDDAIRKLIRRWHEGHRMALDHTRLKHPEFFKTHITKTCTCVYMHTL